MTRQEAKKIMENEVRCVRNPNCERLECRNCYLVMPEHTVLKAYDVAIKALEQEPCEDAISRQAAISDIHEMQEWHTGDAFNADRVIRQLKDLPPVIPSRPTGHWIFEEGDGKTCADGYVCSACNKSFHTHVPYFAEYEFCPHCGAYMVESEEQS